MVVWQNRDEIARVNFFSIELKKRLLKSFLYSSFFSIDDKFYFFKFFHKFGKFSCFSYSRSFCVFSGWTRTVFKFFKLSRHQAKSFASNGFICGLRKSSF